MKNVVVTGGSGTIGSAVVSLFLQNDCNVWVVDKKKPNARPNQHFIECDVTDYDALSELFKTEFAGLTIDSIVTIAGGGLTAEWCNFFEVDIEAIQDSIRLNLMGQINAIHAVLPYMKDASSDRSITMMSSINGKAAYGLAGYSAAKAGLVGFMCGIAKDMGERGIRVNVVSPGTVVTELTLSETKKDWDRLRKGTLTGEFVTPEDVAQLVYTVASNKSINGQNVVIDSGQLIKR